MHITYELLSSSQRARRRRKAATFRMGKISGFSICKPPGDFDNAPSQAETRMPSPQDCVTPIAEISFSLDTSSLVQNLEQLIAQAGFCEHTVAGEEKEEAMPAEDAKPLEVSEEAKPAGAPKDEKNDNDSTVYGDMTEVANATIANTVESTNSCIAASVPVPDSDDEVLDGSGVDLGSTVPDPCLALEHLFVHSSISALVAECNALRAGVDYCSKLDLSNTIWPVYINAHIEHLIRPARSLIDMRRRIRVPKPIRAILSQIGRKWCGGRRAPPASIPISTLEELQFLCNEVDDFIEQYVECPLVTHDRFDTLAQILWSIDAGLRDTCSEGDSVEVNRQYNEAFDRSFRFVWGRTVSLTVLATALGCPEM